MKCSKCGFVSFDDLIECKKCGARLKEKKSPEITGVQQPVPQFEPASDDAARLPPQWHETIQTIKRELEAIEGGAVDKQSRAAAATVTGSASAAQLLSGVAPAASLSPTAAVKGGFILRSLAYLIDCVILYCITLSLLLAGFVLLRSGVADIGRADTNALLRVLFIPYMITSTILEAFYFIYCFAVTGQTVGKWVCGLKVVSTQGELLGFRKALYRWLGYLISRFFLYAGFIWIAFSREKRGWHDMIAGSRVIRV